MQKTRLVQCPICGNNCEYSPQNQFRPFCSKRCQLIDLGQWASEGYTIPQEISADEPDFQDKS